jgi:light-independent protochlorophyllide reductase subunit B
LCTPLLPPPGTKRERAAGERARCNVLGPTALGFRHRDDLREVLDLLRRLDVDVNVVAPLDATPQDLTRLGNADFNVVMYPEVAAQTAAWLARSFGQATIKTVPIGVGATREFIAQVAALSGADTSDLLNDPRARSTWYARSVDSTYLTGKRVYVFGDATHVVAAARIAATELGFQVVGMGTYSREFAREVREAAKLYGVEALITDDYLDVEEQVAALQPELVLGTQMERHIAKRLGIPCAVISAPMHVQDFPARHSPQMGFEGANVMFDAWVHPLMMGLEEHLLHMFRDDFEFHEDAAPSHLGSAAKRPVEMLESAAAPMAPLPAIQAAATAPSADSIMVNTAASDSAAGAVSAAAAWTADAEKELKKIPFFVRGKARRNTEAYAGQLGLKQITVETLYDAKAHYSR